MNKPSTPRRIDAHVHLWQLARGDYDWMSPALGAIYRDFELHDLEPLLKQAEIQEIVVVQAAATVAETEFLLGQAQQSQRIAGVIGWVDFESPTATDSLKRLATHSKLKGIRPMVQFIPDPEWMLRPNLGAGWDALIDLDLALDCLVTPLHLRPLLQLLTSRPRLRAVIDHGAKPAIAGGDFHSWANQMKQLAHETTVYCKISGLVTEAGPQWTTDDLRPYVDHLLTHFGPRRLLFGSDWPVVNLAANYETWLRTADKLLDGLATEERTAIFGENAVAFYRL